MLQCGSKTRTTRPPIRQPSSLQLNSCSASPLDHLPLCICHHAQSALQGLALAIAAMPLHYHQSRRTKCTPTPSPSAPQPSQNTSQSGGNMQIQHTRLQPTRGTCHNLQLNVHHLNLCPILDHPQQFPSVLCVLSPHSHIVIRPEGLINCSWKQHCNAL